MYYVLAKQIFLVKAYVHNSRIGTTSFIVDRTVMVESVVVLLTYGPENHGRGDMLINQSCRRVAVAVVSYLNDICLERGVVDGVKHVSV